MKIKLNGGYFDGEKVEWNGQKSIRMEVPSPYHRTKATTLLFADNPRYVVREDILTTKYEEYEVTKMTDGYSFWFEGFIFQ